MKNLSLQITSPKFLDDSFTTQMDLLTGKVFYHSQLGEYLNMLPPIISDAIEKAIWKYIFSKKVLAIPHEIHIDYCDNHIMKQNPQYYIDKDIFETQHRIEREKNNPGKKNRILSGWESEYIKGEEDRLTVLRNLTEKDVREHSYRYEWQNDGSGNGFRIKKDKKEEVLDGIQNKLEKMCFFWLPDLHTTIAGGNTDYVGSSLCMCFQKNGSMCGCSHESCDIGDYITISSELEAKYLPLVGTCNVQISKRGRAGHGLGLRESLQIVCCKKHGNAWRKEIEHILDDEEYLKAEEKALDEYFAQHNYHYKHGYWVKGDPREGFTLDKTRKHVKKVPYEPRPITKHYTQNKFTPGVSFLQEARLDSWDKTKQEYLPKFSKAMEKHNVLHVNREFSKRYNWQRSRLRNDYQNV